MESVAITWKNGAVWSLPTPAGTRILSMLDRVSQIYRISLEITAGTNDHVLPDVHAKGLAFDVSVRALESVIVVQLYHSLTQLLGSEFTVLYECPTRPDEPNLAAIVTVNPSATAPHLHLQLSNHVPIWPAVETT